MKRNKVLIGIGALALSLTAGIIWASDHADAPNIKGKSTDITDLYVFASPADTNNLVFVGNVQGLMSPATTQTAIFDENTLIEFKIDNTGDNIEDLVIQCVYKNGNMYIYGPVRPLTPGSSSTIVGIASVIVPVTSYTATSPTIVTSSNGLKAFAGPRDDPFYFDLNQFHAITGATATGFNNPGADTFQGTNVMSVVIEIPKSLLPKVPKLNVWLQTKQKV